jgi:hypothetical protein
MLGVWYNYAPIGVETTGGHGAAVLLKLKELVYMNILARLDSPSAIQTGMANRLGIDTNAQNKPAMVAATQSMIMQKMVEIPDEDTIIEMTGFEQDKLPGGGVRYRGAGRSHDDRVMTVVIACYIVSSFPIVDYLQGVQADFLDKYENVSQDDREWREIIHQNMKKYDGGGDPFADY